MSASGNTPRVPVPAIQHVQVVIVDAWMDVKTAAAYMGKHPESVRLLAKLYQVTQGRQGLRHGRDGHKLKFKREHCDEYLLNSAETARPLVAGRHYLTGRGNHA